MSIEIVVLLLVATVVATILLLRWWARLGGARGRARGLRSERRARRLLERAGYKVLRQGVDGRGHVIVDGQRHTVPLRADYLVERAGRQYVVEVKSGGRRRPTVDTTRRQLLEYCLAFDVPSVLLVDADDEVIAEICFDYGAA